MFGISSHAKELRMNRELTRNKCKYRGLLHAVVGFSLLLFSVCSVVFIIFGIIAFYETVTFRKIVFQYELSAKTEPMRISSKSS